MLEMSSSITGTWFRGKVAMSVLKELPEGTVLTLMREPDNAYDEQAIQVLYEEYNSDVNGMPLSLGYIPKTENSQLAKAMDEGRKFSCVYTGNKELVIKEISDLNDLDELWNSDLGENLHIDIAKGSDRTPKVAQPIFLQQKPHTTSSTELSDVDDIFNCLD